MLIYDVVLAAQHGRVVESRIVAGDALIAGMFEIIPHFGGMQQGFRGDATHQQTSAAESWILFNKGGFQSLSGIRFNR